MEEQKTVTIDSLSQDEREEFISHLATHMSESGKHLVSFVQEMENLGSVVPEVKELVDSVLVHVIEIRNEFRQRKAEVEGTFKELAAKLGVLPVTPEQQALNQLQASLIGSAEGGATIH